VPSASSNWSDPTSSQLFPSYIALTCQDAFLHPHPEVFQLFDSDGPGRLPGLCFSLLLQLQNDRAQLPTGRQSFPSAPLDSLLTLKSSD